MNNERYCITKTIEALKNFLPDLELPTKTESEFYEIYDNGFDGSDLETAVYDLYEQIDYFMKEIYFYSNEMLDVDDGDFYEYCPQCTSDMISFIYKHKILLK